MRTVIPHNCSFCGRKLFLEERFYFGGSYYCLDHMTKKSRK